MNKQDEQDKYTNEVPTYEEFIKNPEKYLNKLSEGLDKIKQYLEND